MERYRLVVLGPEIHLPILRESRSIMPRHRSVTPLGVHRRSCLLSTRMRQPATTHVPRSESAVSPVHCHCIGILCPHKVPPLQVFPYGATLSARNQKCSSASASVSASSRPPKRGSDKPLWWMVKGKRSDGGMQSRRQHDESNDSRGTLLRSAGRQLRHQQELC